MFWIEINECFQKGGHFTKRCFVSSPVTHVGFHQGLGCVAAKDVVFNQFIHHLPVFVGKVFLSKISEKDIFFLPVVGTIGVYPNKINSRIYKVGINRFCLLNTLQ